MSERVRPVVVAAAGVGAMLVQEADDAAVLAPVELVEAIDRRHEVAIGNVQPGFELAGIGQVVDVDSLNAG